MLIMSKLVCGYYDVVLSTASTYHPVLHGVARCLSDKGLRCLGVEWNRDRCYPVIERKECFDIVRAHFRGQYGGGMKNLYGLIRWNLYLLALYLKVRPKIIHAYDFDTVIPALIAKAFIKSKVVYHIADWYAVTRRVGPLKPLIENAERWACRMADLVILPHESRLQQVGFAPRKWLVIYNSPQDYFHLQQDMESKYLIDDYFAYVGILHSDRGLKQIIEAASTIGARVILAGFGPLEAYCKKVSSTVPRIEFLGRKLFDDVLAIERNAVAIIALYDPKLQNNRLAAPNKLYEAMMLGRPLITNKGTLVGDLVEKEKIGITVEYGNVQELSQAMDRLIKDSKMRAEMGRNARKLYEKQYSFAIQCEKLQQAYQELYCTWSNP